MTTIFHEQPQVHCPCSKGFRIFRIFGIFFSYFSFRCVFNFYIFFSLEHLLIQDKMEHIFEFWILVFDFCKNNKLSTKAKRPYAGARKRPRIGPYFLIFLKGEELNILSRSIFLVREEYLYDVLSLSYSQ